MSKVTVAVCATGLASTSPTPGRRPSTCSTTAFSLAQPSPPTCKTVVATLPDGHLAALARPGIVCVLVVCHAALLTLARPPSPFTLPTLYPWGVATPDAGLRVQAPDGAGYRIAAPGAAVPAAAYRSGSASKAAAQPARAEIHGVRSAAAVSGGMWRVHCHPAYRIGYRARLSGLPPAPRRCWASRILRFGVNLARRAGAARGGSGAAGWRCRRPTATTAPSPRRR